MTTPSSPLSPTLTKTQVLTELNQFPLDEDIKADVRNWLNIQTGDTVPRQELIQHMLGIAETETFVGQTYNEMAQLLKETKEDLEKVEERQTIAELQVQHDAMKEIKQYADMAEALVNQTTQDAQQATADQQSSSTPAPSPIVT